MPLTTVCNKPAQSNIPTNMMGGDVRVISECVSEYVPRNYLTNSSICSLQTGISHGIIIEVKIVHSDVNELNHIKR